MSSPEHVDPAVVGRRPTGHLRRRESDVPGPQIVKDKPLRREGDSSEHLEDVVKPPT